jgi:hypothetical protein
VRLRTRAFLPVVVAAVAVSAAPAASAATVTVGSPLTSFDTQYGASGNNTTAANQVLAEAGAHASSPVDGTITQWHLTTITTGVFALHVVRSSYGGFGGAGTSAQTVTSPGAHTFAANLPIHAGDLIGVDIPDGGAVAAQSANGSTYIRWYPALLDSSPRVFDSSYPGEVLVSADVEPTPAPAGTAHKKCKKKKHKRSASAAKKKCRKKKK